MNVIRSRISVSQLAQYVFCLIVVAIILVRTAPQVVAFPNHVSVGEYEVYSEQPVMLAEIAPVIATAEALLKQSPIYEAPRGQRLFLTDGEWRWRLLALTSANALAFSLPVTENIIINRNSVASNRIMARKMVGGKRSLSSVIAHERTHGLLRTHYGWIRSVISPSWKTEGYCDFVAQESSLNAAQVARLRQEGKSHPALVYFEGRQKVARILAESGGSVDALFK